MIPRSILSGLKKLRRRERVLRFLWGAAKLVALVAVVILAGCLVDWLWDRTQDTPEEVRHALLGLTISAGIMGVLGWIIWPQCERLLDDDLALWVERKHPEFQNRLISAVQLNRPGADKRGMSEELIAITTREAEARADEIRFKRVADHQRFAMVLKLLIPLGLVIGGLFLWQPTIGPVLLARHFLADTEIPRRTRLEPMALSPVYPAGEKVTLKFRVTGEGFDESTQGFVDVTPQGQPRDRYTLKFDDKDANGRAIFAAEVAPSSTDLSYQARLGDGRMKKPGTVKIVPRPAILDLAAFSVLPPYCGLKPSGGRYEVAQGRGDIVGIPGSGGKIVATTQKPIAKGRVEILGPEKFDPQKSAEDMGPEKVTRTIDCTITGKDQKAATASWELKPEETGYRVIVADEYGFENTSPPRRNLRMIPEEPPTVVLLKNYFTPFAVNAKEPLDDFDYEGFPVPVGSVMRVPYLAEGPYGLGQAWFLYRVLKKTESGNEVVAEEPFKRVPLPEVFGTKKTGDFDPRRGVFEHTPPDKGVDFVALPSLKPEEILGRTVGGGRYHFKTDGVPDGKGGIMKLSPGDRIEYCIEIFADKEGRPGRPVARSETRVQELGTLEGLERWLSEILQEERKLKDLDQKQRAVFGQ